MVITTGTVFAGNRAVTSVAAEFRRSEGEAAGSAILESSERPGGSREPGIPAAQSLVPMPIPS